MSIDLDISKLSVEDRYSLFNGLSIQRKNKYYRNSVFGEKEEEEPIIFYLPSKKHSFGVKIPINYCLNLLDVKLEGDHYDIIKNYKSSLNFFGELYNDQEKVFKDSLDSCHKNHGVILDLRTGYGKTVIASKLACTLNKITIVLVSLTSLIEQWKNTFNEFTNAKIWVVDKKNKIPKDFNIIICMNMRINQIPDDISDQIGTVIVDEAHLFCTRNRVEALLYFNPLYFIACTATLERNDGLHDMILKITGKNYSTRSLEINFEVWRFFTGFKPSLDKNLAGQVDWAKYLNETSMNKMKNSIIVTLATELKDRKILILTKRREQCDIIYDCLKNDEWESVDIFYGKKSEYSNSRILVGTADKIGTGFDEKSSCNDYDGERINTIILCFSILKESSLVQYCGRAFRSRDPLVIEILDDDRIAENHAKARMKWYNKKSSVVYNKSIEYDEVTDIDGKITKTKKKTPINFTYNRVNLKTKTKTKTKGKREIETSNSKKLAKEGHNGIVNDFLSSYF